MAMETQLHETLLEGICQRQSLKASLLKPALELYRSHRIFQGTEEEHILNKLVVDILKSEQHNLVAVKGKKTEKERTSGSKPRAGKDIANSGLLKEGAQDEIHVHSSTTQSKGTSIERTKKPTAMTRNRQGKVLREKNTHLLGCSTSGQCQKNQSWDYWHCIFHKKVTCIRGDCCPYVHAQRKRRADSKAKTHKQKKETEPAAVAMVLNSLATRNHE